MSVCFLTLVLLLYQSVSWENKAGSFKFFNASQSYPTTPSSVTKVTDFFSVYFGFLPGDLWEETSKNHSLRGTPPPTHAQALTGSFQIKWPRLGAGTVLQNSSATEHQMAKNKLKLNLKRKIAADVTQWSVIGSDLMDETQMLSLFSSVRVSKRHVQGTAWFIFLDSSHWWRQHFGTVKQTENLFSHPTMSQLLTQCSKL